MSVDPFQIVMYYVFHHIKPIAKPYIDDLPTHSMQFQDHLTHLRAIFLHCEHYNICLIAYTFVFYVKSKRLIGFIMSKRGINVGPLTVEAIVILPPPSTLPQLQSLQEKVNFLRHFIPNYDELMKST